MQKTDFHCLSFFAETSHLELIAQKHFFELLRTPILCLVQTNANYENGEATRCSKASSQSEKVAKCNFKSKAQLHNKMIISHEIKCFLQCRRQISRV